MWSPSPRCSCLRFLLSLLWTVGRSGAESPSTDAGSAFERQQTLRLIVQELKAEMEPLISQLALRIDRLDSRLTSLDSRLASLDSRLNALDFRQDAFEASLHDHSSRIESRLVPLISRMNSTGAGLDQLESKVSAIEGKLDAGLIPLNSRMNFTDAILHQLVFRVNVTEDRLGSRVEELASQVNGTSAAQSDRLEGVTFRLDDLSSHLDDLVNLTGTFHPSRDCSKLPTWTRSGIYQLQLERSQPPVPAYCDLETDGGGWTVIQRRKDIQPRQDFNRNWANYREGFGDLDGEHWWGLQNMWKLTGAGNRQYELRVDLADFEGGRRYAHYSRFRVGPEADGFPLTVSGYSGTAGDSLGYHNGDKFSTMDRDQDEASDSCAQRVKGGWWFGYCYDSFLNGPYLSGKQDKAGGVIWNEWRDSYSLREAEMKIRPV